MIKANKKIAVTALLSAALLSVAHANDSVDTTLRDSERMISNCLDYATSQKLTPFSVAVLDASGTLIAFKRQDGATTSTVDAALLKAKTAMRVNAPTAVLDPAIGNDASLRNSFQLLQMTTLPGGFPLNDKSGHVIGAVGVSGGTNEQDTECARRAVEGPSGKSK